MIRITWYLYILINSKIGDQKGGCKAETYKNWQKHHSQVSKIWDKWDIKNDQNYLIFLHNNFQKDRRAKRWLQSWNLKELTVAPPSGFKDMRQMRF